MPCRRGRNSGVALCIRYSSSDFAPAIDDFQSMRVVTARHQLRLGGNLPNTEGAVAGETMYGVLAAGGNSTDRQSLAAFDRVEHREAVAAVTDL